MIKLDSDPDKPTEARIAPSLGMTMRLPKLIAQDKKTAKKLKTLCSH